MFKMILEIFKKTEPVLQEVADPSIRFSLSRAGRVRANIKGSEVCMNGTLVVQDSLEQGTIFIMGDNNKPIYIDRSAARALIPILYRFVNKGTIAV